MIRKSWVAIDTVPLPERPAFRLERFLVDKLVEAKVIDREAESRTRFGLALGALREAELVGYILDYPHVCLSDNPPEWCKYAGAVITDGRVLLIDALLENGRIDQTAWSGWRGAATKLGLADFAPRLFQEIGLKSDRSLEILDQASVASVAMPLPGSDLDRYSREHPEDPICQVASQPFDSIRGRRLASELVMVSLLHHDKVLKDEQVTAVYNGYYEGLTAGLGLSDLSPYFGGVTTEGLTLGGKEKAAISVAIGRHLGAVGYVDPDGPWADICSKPSPPRICWFISRFPAAAALTTELVRRKIWPEKAALQAWNEAAAILSQEPIPMTRARTRRATRRNPV